MPVSVPWQAPERHHCGHLFSEMVKMDIYSFGLVCLWLLFNEKLCENGLVFDALPNKRPHPLELKKQNGLDETAERLVYESKEILASQTGSLEVFFRSCLTSDPGNRAFDMNVLINLLDAKSPMKVIVSSKSSAEDSSNSREPFQVGNIILTVI